MNIFRSFYVQLLQIGDIIDCNDCKKMLHWPSFCAIKCVCVYYEKRREDQLLERMPLDNATLSDSIAIFIWRKASSNEVHDNVEEKMDGWMDGESGVSSSSTEASRYSFEKGPILYGDEHHVFPLFLRGKCTWRIRSIFPFLFRVLWIWRIINDYRGNDYLCILISNRIWKRFLWKI